MHPLSQLVQIAINSIKLEGNLRIPMNASTLVIFAHGSGSSLFSPRNNFVAQVLQKQGIATLLADLLTQTEDELYENRFDIELLTERLIKITQWAKAQPTTKTLSIGYFGASTGAAAALAAASQLGNDIKAVVSRGGRPDLAMEVLLPMTSPTLLIVGGADTDVIGLNQQAFEKLSCVKEIKIVEGATHLFEEPGALEEVAKLAAEWFKKYL